MLAKKPNHSCLWASLCSPSHGDTAFSKAWDEMPKHWCNLPELPGPSFPVSPHLTNSWIIPAPPHDSHYWNNNGSRKDPRAIKTERESAGMRLVTLVFCWSFFKFSLRESALYKGKKKSRLLYLAGVSNACFASCSGPSLCHQFHIFFKALYWSLDERILSWFDWMPARGIKSLWLLHVGLL